MLNISKKCISCVLFYVNSHLWHLMALEKGPSIAGALLWSSRLGSLSRVHKLYTAKHCTYVFQLVQRHCGICRSINQDRNGDGRQLCLFTILKTTSTYSQWKQNKAWLSMSFIWSAQSHGEQQERVIWSTNGSGNNVLYYGRESRWNTKHWRRLHPSLTDAFIRRRQDVQSNELVISICDAGLKVWWICILLFLNVHMLCWKAQWKDFFSLLRYNPLTIGTTHITAISCCYDRDTKH